MKTQNTEGGKAQGTAWLPFKAVAVVFLINRASFQGAEEPHQKKEAQVKKTPNSKLWLLRPRSGAEGQSLDLF